MKEYKGDLEGFPEEIVEAMLDEQERQGNKRDVTVFECDLNTSEINKGFSWICSNDGCSFWHEVIFSKNFDHFFEKYPKKNEYPKVMWVSNRPITPKSLAIKRVVFHEVKEKGVYLAWLGAETLEDAEKIKHATSWKYAKNVDTFSIPEYTIEELQQKLGEEFKIVKSK